jgi:hypothetical protein
MAEIALITGFFFHGHIFAFIWPKMVLGDYFPNSSARLPDFS